MNRRIILIIAAAVAFALLVGFIWLTFFKGSPAQPTTGTFGSGDTRTNTGGTSGGSQNNVPSNVLPGANGTAGAQTGSTGGSGSTGNGSLSTLTDVPGVDWLGGSGSGGTSGGPTTNFVPKTANQLNAGNVYGSPNITGSAGTGDNNDFLGTALFGAGIAGAVACTPGLLGGVVSGGVNGVAGTAITEAEGVVAVPVVSRSANILNTYGNTLNSNDTFRENFLDCLARTIARAAIQQITASVVNWINSGFNGQPSFVTNYQQFFTNVADQAAGEFIRSSALSFLCSPFQNQIRTAVAQSYARRNSPSCTLSGIIGNLNSFTSGNFSQGGWQGMLALLGVPTNNPFGAYQYAQNGLASAQNRAVAQKQQDYTLGQGFLSSTKPVNCRTVNGRQVCDTVVTTPGSTIAASLNKTLGVSQDSLNLAKSFDEVISALITQLMTRTLQGGLSNLSGTQGYASNFLTPQEQQAQKDAQQLLAQLQGQGVIAQQYGAVQQGSIGDIQNTQQQLQGLVNCWEEKGNATQASSTQVVQHSYDPQIDGYNAKITRANDGIAKLQELQTQAISVGSAKDVEAVKAAYQAALSSGTLITEADVTTAQQDRATLQSILAQRNSQTITELAQCHAL